MAKHAELEGSPFWNQQLPSFRPMFTPGWVGAGLLVAGAALLGVGIWVLQASDGAVEVGPLRYDNLQLCQSALQASPCSVSRGTAAPGDADYLPLDPLCWRRDPQDSFGNECSIPVTIDQDMKKPVYFYYELRGFHQNQRVYVKSQASKQLRGGKEEWNTEKEYRDYLNAQCVESGFDQCKEGLLKSSETDGRFFCNPCGLAARSFFTDTFDVTDAAGELLTGTNWTQTGVAWPRDIEEKFGETASDNR